MNQTRVIPVLLLHGGGLVKTVKFKQPKYVGDPINAVRIFNEKEVDEIVFLDISATTHSRGPDFSLLADITGEAYMPMAYGGGITHVDQVRQLFALGFEKVVINSAAFDNPDLIRESAQIYGSQSIIGCIDVRRTILGTPELYSNSGRSKRNVTLRDHVASLRQAGIGEIIVNSIDRDGTQAGYDLRLIREVANAIDVPVVACGGAKSIDDFVAAVDAGASAVAAGSVFVFYGPHRAVLINYPDRSDLVTRLS